MGNYKATLGLEEEFFALEQGEFAPSFQSFDYLRTYWWEDLRTRLHGSASNFAKGKDRKACFMGSIELSTGKHHSAEALIEDLSHLRTAFAKASVRARIVPVGALIGIETPSNTASSHVHVGVPDSERKRVYENIAYFLPAIAIMSACSPILNSKSQDILSFRLSQANLLGLLKEDPTYRFQDIIVSRRLGTIELRVLDPIPEIDRLKFLLGLIQKLAEWDGEIALNREQYNSNRMNWASKGFECPTASRLLDELQVTLDIDCQPFKVTLSEKLKAVGEREAIYDQLDHIWREPTGTIAHPATKHFSSMMSGLCGYYLPRLPFIAYKGYAEWYGRKK